GDRCVGAPPPAELAFAGRPAPYPRRARSVESTRGRSGDLLLLRCPRGGARGAPTLPADVAGSEVRRRGSCRRPPDGAARTRRRAQRNRHLARLERGGSPCLV